MKRFKDFIKTCKEAQTHGPMYTIDPVMADSKKYLIKRKKKDVVEYKVFSSEKELLNYLSKNSDISDIIIEKCEFDGLAKGKTLADIAKKHKTTVDALQKQLNMGIKIELEHTKSHELAKKIAMDHLYEKPDYYTKLKQVEQENAPVNSVGGGNVAGIGPGEVPPIRTSLGKVHMRFPKKRKINRPAGFKYQAITFNGGSAGGVIPKYDM